MFVTEGRERKHGGVKFSIIYFPYNNSRYTDIILQSMILYYALVAALLNVKSHDTRETRSRLDGFTAPAVPLMFSPYFVHLLFPSYSLILYTHNTGISSLTAEPRVCTIEMNASLFLGTAESSSSHRSDKRRHKTTPKSIRIVQTRPPRSSTYTGI